VSGLSVSNIRSECLKINAEQYSGLRDLPTNIIFFCSECLHRLPEAVLAFNEACKSIEKKINSIEESLSNKFTSLADQLSDLSSKISYDLQEPNTEMAGEDLPPSQRYPSLSVELIVSMTASIVSEEVEKE